MATWAFVCLVEVNFMIAVFVQKLGIRSIRLACCDIRIAHPCSCKTTVWLFSKV